MNKGVLIFAHNSRDVDYVSMALVSAKLAKKHLEVPVSLVTDNTTLEWTQQSSLYANLVETFDKIVEIEKPQANNQRKLHDGVANKTVPFINSSRPNVWDLTPYDRTLMIDSDFLIFSDRLNEYWSVDEDLLISDSMTDIYDSKRVGYHDRYISDTGVHLYWATTVMFTKNEYTKTFFDLVQYIRDNYQYYGDLFRFDTRQYRNDIAFSVAKHILGGFETNTKLSLPSILTVTDKDILHSVSDNGQLTFLVSPMLDSNYFAAAINGMDVHVMNKQSLTRNVDALMRLA